MLKLRGFVSTTKNVKYFLHGRWVRWKAFFNFMFREQKFTKLNSPWPVESFTNYKLFTRKTEKKWMGSPLPLADLMCECVANSCGHCLRVVFLSACFTSVYLLLVKYVFKASNNISYIFVLVTNLRSTIKQYYDFRCVFTRRYPMIKAIVSQS